MLAAFAFMLAVAHMAQAQHLSVNELIDLRAKSLEELQTVLGKKGWVYRGQCGTGEDGERYCFKIGDKKGDGLASVLYVVKNGDDQSLEYTVYRPGLITQIQNNIRNAAFKLVGQKPINEQIKLRVYEKGQDVLVARGGVDRKYYSLEIHQKPSYRRMQASR